MEGTSLWYSLIILNNNFYYNLIKLSTLSLQSISRTLKQLISFQDKRRDFTHVAYKWKDLRLLISVRTLPLLRSRCDVYPPRCYNNASPSTYWVHVTFAMCFTKCKAQRWRTFPKCGAGLGYPRHLILGMPPLWALNLHFLVTPPSYFMDFSWPLYLKP
jgi:hypothetical protein